jgi:hypothetical protein
MPEEDLHAVIGVDTHRDTRAEAKSSHEHLTWTDVTVRRLRHGAQRRRLVGGRTAGSL